jgi:hypothetical protein
MEENNNKIENVIIGIYNGQLSKTGKYKALIGLELLEYENIVEVDAHNDTKIRC